MVAKTKKYVKGDDLMALSVVIIPNENNLNIPIYHDSIESGRHNEMLNNFCELYSIENIFGNADLNITYAGHITIETADGISLATTWIPDDITDSQYENLLNTKDIFSNYNNVAFKTWPSNAIDINKTPDGYNGSTVDYFYEELEKFYKENKSRK